LAFRGNLGDLSLPLGQICERMNFYVDPQEDEAVLRTLEICGACSVIAADNLEVLRKRHMKFASSSCYGRRKKYSRGTSKRGHCISIYTGDRLLDQDGRPPNKFPQLIIFFASSLQEDMEAGSLQEAIYDILGGA